MRRAAREGKRPSGGKGASERQGCAPPDSVDMRRKLALHLLNNDGSALRREGERQKDEEEQQPREELEQDNRAADERARRINGDDLAHPFECGHVDDNVGIDFRYRAASPGVDRGDCPAADGSQRSYRARHVAFDALRHERHGETTADDRTASRLVC